MENGIRKNYEYFILNYISKIEKKSNVLKNAVRKIRKYWYIRFTNKNGQLHIVLTYVRI